MDLSKLPKLSETSKHTPAPSNEKPAESPAAEPLGSGLRPQPVFDYRSPAVTYRQPGVGVDIWISLIIGLLLMALGGTFARWAIATLRHQPFHTGVTWSDDAHPANQEVEYFDLQGYTALSDMGIFLFGVTLLFEAATKAFLVIKPGTVSRLLLMLAVVFTLSTVLLNMYACIKMFNYGLTPLISGLAVAFGGWILFDEWATLKAVTPVAKKPADFIR